uniref:Osteoclast-stimulating factor 1 n=1 Tax=Astyanax mexicanus TaxID=7994 RepID=A0A8B9R937_ASTMX
MEVLVLIDFEGTLGDELSVRAGDVVKNVKAASEDGWLEGELRGKRGIFPSNFVKEVPVHLMGDSKREPRSMRTSKMPLKDLCRKCEVTYTYMPQNEDELELAVGETVEILREIEDGWWMGKKNNKIGAFPSNFVKEIFPKGSKSRPKLSDSLFTKEVGQSRSVLHTAWLKECCQVMFDYTAVAEDELNLKKGDIVTIISKASEDDGWWEGELNGRRGFFPDNFVMVIPMDTQVSGVGKCSHTDEKPDFRSDSHKVKLTGLFRTPPPPTLKEKPLKLVSKKNEDLPPASSKSTENEHKDSDQLDVVNVSSEKLVHPTAHRAKPPQRRPPTGLHASSDTNQNEASTQIDGALKKQDVSSKVTENHLPSSSILHPAQPKPTEVKSPAEKPTLDQVLAELKELRMALELLKTQHSTDMKELKDELGEERSKRMKLQDEVQALRKQK